MGLKDSVLAERRQRGGVCSFVSVYAALSKRDAAELREMLVDPAVNDAMIMRGLATATGIKLGSSTVGRHRNLECSCGTV